MKSQLQLSAKGYSILELVTVIAVLSTLASLSLPNVLRIFDFNNVEEAKTLLNTAAADCLQQSRIESSPIIYSDTVDEAKSNTLGYSLDSTSKPDQGSSETGAKCSFLLLNPTNTNDTIRYPIGFSVSQGELTKFADRPSADAASIQSCENWAGDNCATNSSDAQKTIANSNTANAIAQQTCEADYEDWTPSATGKSEYNRWNSDTNSCDKTIYAYDGKIVGYDKCSQQLAKDKADKTDTNDESSEGTTRADCPGREFWFYQGTDLGSQAALKSHKSKAEEEACREKREYARQNNSAGSKICYLPQAGPGDCGAMTYLIGNTYVELDYFLSQKEDELNLEEGEEPDFKHLTCGTL